MLPLRHYGPINMRLSFSTSTVGMLKVLAVCRNMITAVLLWNRLSLIHLCRYMCMQLRLSGTISYVVCQTLIIAVRLYCGLPPPPPDVCLYECQELEFRVSSKLFAGMIMEKKNIYITDEI